MRDAMLIVHFIGLAMGLGTSFGMMFLGIAGSKLEPAEAKKFMFNSLALTRMGHIGLGLLIISGLYLMTPWWGTLGDMPLLIVKLILVLILTLLIGYMTSTAGKARRTDSMELMGKVKPLGQVALLTAIAIVVLAVLVFH